MTSDRQAGSLRSAAREWSLPLGLILATAATLPGIENGYERFHAPRLAIALLAATACAAATRWTPGPRLTTVAALGTLSCGFSLAPAYGVIATLTWVVTPLWASQVATLDKVGQERLRAALVACGLAVALLVLTEAWVGVWAWRAPGRGPGAFWGQRNLAAALLSLTIAVIVAAPAHALHQALALAPLTSALVLTRSRAGWVAAILALAVSAGVSQRKSGRLLGALVGVVVALVMPSALAWRSPTPFWDTATHLVDPRSPSAAGRLTRWAHSLQLCAEQPLLGTGPGHWRFEYPRVSPPEDRTWDHRHPVLLGQRLNGDAVALAVEWGPLTALGLALLGLGWLRQGTRSPEHWPVVAALVPWGLVDVLAQVPLQAAFLGGALGLGWESAGQAKRSRGAPAALAVLLAASGWATSHAVGVAMRVRSDASVADLERAAALAPGDVEGHRRLVEVLILQGRCEVARAWLDRLRPVCAADEELAVLAASCPLQ